MDFRPTLMAINRVATINISCHRFFGRRRLSFQCVKRCLIQSLRETHSIQSFMLIMTIRKKLNRLKLTLRTSETNEMTWHWTEWGDRLSWSIKSIDMLIVLQGKTSSQTRTRLIGLTHVNLSTIQTLIARILEPPRQRLFTFISCELSVNIGIWFRFLHVWVLILFGVFPKRWRQTMHFHVTEMWAGRAIRLWHFYGL